MGYSDGQNFNTLYIPAKPCFFGPLILDVGPGELFESGPHGGGGLGIIVLDPEDIRAGGFEVGEHLDFNQGGRLGHVGLQVVCWIERSKERWELGWDRAVGLQAFISSGASDALHYYGKITRQEAPSFTKGAPNVR